MITEHFKIEIRHYNFQGGGFPKVRKMDDHRDFKRPKYNGKTEVTIKDKETDEVLGVGLALCSQGDNFHRAYGSLVAVTRAWKDLSQEQRMEIRDAFLTLPSVQRLIKTDYFKL